MFPTFPSTPLLWLNKNLPWKTRRTLAFVVAAAVAVRIAVDRLFSVAVTTVVTAALAMERLRTELMSPVVLVAHAVPVVVTNHSE